MNHKKIEYEEQRLQIYIFIHIKTSEMITDVGQKGLFLSDFKYFLYLPSKKGKHLFFVDTMTNLEMIYLFGEEVVKNGKEFRQKYLKISC